MVVSQVPMCRFFRRASHALVLALIATALIGSMGSAVRADQITDDNVNAMMAAATTPAEHDALAAFFTKKAEAALASAEAHDRMGAPYAAKSPNINAHCRNLAASFRKEAKDYAALAKEEAALAKGTPKAMKGKKDM